jgi:hypothetical protein
LESGLKFLEGADFGDDEPDDENDYGINKYTKFCMPRKHIGM